jgi:ABC-type multidrug transport system ATPase subunit
MEEAEALCQKIGIMAKGTLRCLANPLRLKELYGSGFKLYANCEAHRTCDAKAFFESILPNGWTLVDHYETLISYEFPGTKGTISRLFDEIESQRSMVGVLDWGIGQTTLEEVFLKLISEGDASAEY